MHDPETPQQWQEAVDAAQGILALEYARLLGLMTNTNEINVERCAAILTRGAELGVTPAEGAIRDFVCEAASEEDRERIYRVVSKALEMTGNPNLAEIVPFLARAES